MRRALRAEAVKLATLPAAWISLFVGVVVPVGVVVITSLTARPGLDTGFQELALGAVGVIALGVVAMSSEYATEGVESADGRQVWTSLTAVPGRARMLLAKIVVVAAAAGALAVVATAATFATVALLLGSRAPAIDGDALARMGGLVAYWVLTALLALGITVLTRSGLAPMVVLIANTSAVTVTYLLTKVTSWANYLPDMAGLRMFSRTLDTGVSVGPALGGLVMTAWVAGLLVVGALIFMRRDA